MAVNIIYPIYDKDSHVSNNSFESFKKLAPESVKFTNTEEEADLLIVFETVDNSIACALGLRRLLDPRMVVIAEGDRFNFPLLPGLYVSITTDFANPDRAFSHAYFSYLAETDGNPYCKGYIETEKQYRCCFTGKSNLPLRSRIFNTLSEEPGFYLRDTMQTYRHFVGKRDTDQQESFVRLIRESEFSICPRGKGASLIRLFESMRLGTAPVILGDAWTPPLGPDWDSFSIRVKESEVDRIPKLLEENRHRYKEMGRLARKAYEQYFSTENLVSDSLKQLERFSKHRSFEKTTRVRRKIYLRGLHSLRRLKLRLSNR